MACVCTVMQLLHVYIRLYIVHSRIADFAELSPSNADLHEICSATAEKLMSHFYPA